MPNASNLAALVKRYKSTAEIPVPGRIAGQVIGQEKGVELIKKAAAQKRNVLLTGLPGTGKSMMAQAMAEILPVSALHDILIYPNPADANNPKAVAVKAGKGKQILQHERLEAQRQEDNMRLISLLLPLGWFILSAILWQLGWFSDIIFAALLILGGFLMIGFALGTQMRAREARKTPKMLVDNTGKKTAPFVEATGARAGALLGDVRHDPLQCHMGFNSLYIQQGEHFIEKPFAEIWSEMYEKYGKEVIRNDKGYEAIMLPPRENIYALGYKSGRVVLARILSLNRQPFDGELIDLKVEDKTLSVTPEHKVNTTGADKEADKISKYDSLIKLVKLEVAKIFN